MPKVVNFEMQGMEIKNFTQRTLCNLGQKGSGKTTLLRMVADALPPRTPCIIFDALDVIDLPDVLAIKIHRKNMIQGKIASYIVNNKLRKKQKVIIKFINMLDLEVSTFMDEFIPRIRMHDGIWMFDEVHTYCPEIATVGGHYSAETERMIRHTRNDNNCVYFNSQRPSFLSKRILALSDFLILFRVFWPSDLKVVEQLVHDKNIVAALPGKSFLQGYTLDYDPNSGAYLNQSTPPEILNSK